MFFGHGYKVLRGGSWATRAPRHHPDLPQLGLPAAPADLLRPADREGPDVRALLDTDEIRIESWLSESRRAQPRQRRARRAHAPVQGAAAQALLRHPRARSCSSRSASCPSTTRPAPSGRSSSTAPTRSSRETGAGELVELGSGAADKARILLDAMAGAGTLRRYVPFDVSEQVVRDAAEQLVDEYDGLHVHGVVGDFERHLEPRPAPAATPRIVALLGGTIGNFPPGTPPAAAAQDRRAARPRGPAAARHRPGQGPGRDRGRLRRLRRASPPSSTATSCT